MAMAVRMAMTVTMISSSISVNPSEGFNRIRRRARRLVVMGPESSCSTPPPHEQRGRGRLPSLGIRGLRGCGYGRVTVAASLPLEDETEKVPAVEEVYA